MTKVRFDVSYEQTRSLVVESLGASIGASSGGQVASLYANIARLVIQRLSLKKSKVSQIRRSPKNLLVVSTSNES